MALGFPLDYNGLRRSGAEVLFEAHAKVPESDSLFCTPFVSKYLHSNCYGKVTPKGSHSIMMDGIVALHYAPPKYYLIPSDDEINTSGYSFIHQKLIRGLHQCQTFGAFISSSDQNHLVSFHAYAKYKQCIKDIKGFLNNTFKGKWIKYKPQCLTNEIDIKTIQNVDLDVYEFAQVPTAFTHSKTMERCIGKGVSVRYQFLSKQTWFRNKFDDMEISSHHSICVSKCQWTFDANEWKKCVIITFANCQNDIKPQYVLAMDYRCIRHSTLMPFDKTSYVIKPFKYWPLFYDIYEDSAITTPRQALYFFALGAQMLHDMIHEKYWWMTYSEYFPSIIITKFIAQPLFLSGLVDALYRLLLRFSNGLCVYSFECNSTAEEFLVHLIISMETEYNSKANRYLANHCPLLFTSLPVYGKMDTNMHRMIEYGLVDEDVLLLYNDKNITTKINANHICCRFLDLAHLNPTTWFIPFKDDKMDEYKSNIPLNQATLSTKLVIYVLRALEQNNHKKHQWFAHSHIKQLYSSYMFSNNRKQIIVAPDEILMSKAKISETAMDGHWILNIDTIHDKVVSRRIVDIVVVMRQLQKHRLFDYLKSKHDIFTCYLEHYYYHLIFVFVRKTTRNKSTKVIMRLLQIYQFMLGIMAMGIMRSCQSNPARNANAKDSECNQYFRNRLNTILSNKKYLRRLTMLCKSIKKSNSVSLDLLMAVLRAPIAFILNNKTRRRNHRFMVKVYRSIKQKMKCGNKHCGNKYHKLKICDGCKYKRYCSRPCQKSDWKLHKIQCLTHRPLL
eukprot:426185_1